MSIPATIRVVIPLTVKRRNGRPRIVPPHDVDARRDQAQEPHLLRAIARAWNWRRMLERGEVRTLQDIAATDKVTLPFVSRTIRLAYLAPGVLERLLLHRCPCALTLDKLAAVAMAPWTEQIGMAFDE
jgi:hypothetical protein